MSVKTTVKGKFIYKDELKYDGNIFFDIEEISNSQKAIIKAVLNDNSSKILDIPFYPWSFEADTKERGFELKVNGMTVIRRGFNFNNKGKKFDFDFSFSEFELGIRKSNEYYEFYIPNFIIAFDNMQKTGSDLTRNVSSFEVRYEGIKYLVELTGLNDVVKKSKEMIDSNEDFMTVKATIRRFDSLINFEEAQKVIDMILNLITVVIGDRIVWKYALSNSEENSFRFIREVKYPEIRPFRKLIREDFPGILSNYITMCFPIYANLNEEERKNLSEFVFGIQFSSHRLNFPAPIVFLGSAIEEYVKEVISDVSVHYVDKTTRKKVFPSFKQFVENEILPSINPFDSDDFNEDGLKQKLAGLLQRNLRSRITSLLQTFGIEHDPNWVRVFVKKRNEAAHGNYKFDPDDYLVWSRMASLLELVVFKRLGFKGKYTNWSTSPPSETEL